MSIYILILLASQESNLRFKVTILYNFNSLRGDPNYIDIETGLLARDPPSWPSSREPVVISIFTLIRGPRIWSAKSFPDATETTPLGLAGTL